MCININMYIHICMCAHVCTHICIHICTHAHEWALSHSFSDSFHSRLLHIKYSSLCYMVGLGCLPILYMASIVLRSVAWLCLTLCNPKDCSLAGSSAHWNSPGKNTGVHCHVLFQGIFLTQRSNSGLPHCRRIL